MVDKEGRTPPLFAKYHNGGTVEYLLDHGANPDKANNDGAFLLHYAAELGICEMIELLLAKGAYVDPVSARGTPLHVAAAERHYDAMKILLDHNADYNKMVNGVTPLMAATDANSTECIKLLVKVQEEPMLKREIAASELISLGSISLKKKDYVVAAKLYSQVY
ncbi:unnamed protein product [Triticum turgidum subsp. durum]|uniref:Ankyrin repeat protein n=1 Tax=Triticum turgidum subsp. durum TaxID=4567 RepID=A0A9R1BR58_TRITD|nr:unnamed protein product [Triticum turgidum subsp. durum]